MKTKKQSSLNTFLILVVIVVLTSCVSKKKFIEMETEKSRTQELLNSATRSEKACIEKLEVAISTSETLQNQVNHLSSINAQLLNNVGDLATLSVNESANLEQSLERIQEKDLQITRLQDALTKKDSVTLALVVSLKGSLGNLNDTDIQINVEKGAVFISISDKLLFRSGSYTVTKQAIEVLGKVATVVNDKPELEFMVEGHTDNQRLKPGVLLDNWDLSVKRATSVVRILQGKFNVEPSRMTASGRSYYVPIADNTTTENRAKNRRTRIIVIPKIDEFYKLVDEGMKEAKSK